MGLQQIGLSAILEMGGFIKGMGQYIGGIGQMEQKTGGLANTLRNVGSGIVGFAGTLAKVGVGAIVGMSAAVGGVAAGIGKLAMEAAPLEGIGIAFEAMASKAGLSLDELRAASRGTVSDFELMRNANVALTGSGEQLGQEFGKNLPRLMEIAGASARATGQDAGFLFQSLVTGIKRTSPMLIDNTGLQLKLGEANEKLAASLGKSVDELSAEEKQIALLYATVEAGQTIIDDFGGGQLTAAERIAQMRASIQNAKDQIGLAFLPALNAILTPLGELAQKYLPQVVTWAEKAGAWLGENLPIAIQWLAGVWTTTLQPALQTVIGFIQGTVIPILQQVWAWLAQNLPIAIQWLSGFWTSTLQPAIQTVTDFIVNQVIPAIQQVWAWLAQNLPVAIEFLSGFWTTTLQPALQTVAEFITNTVVPALMTIVSWFQNAGSSAGEIAGVVAEKWPQIQNTISTVIEAIKGEIQWFLDEVKAWWSEHGESIKSIVTTFMNAIKAVITTVTTVIGNIWNTHGDTIKKIWTTAWTIIKTTVSIILGIIGDIIDAFAALLKGDWKRLGDELKSIWNRLWTAIRTILETAKTAILKIWEKIKTEGKRIWEGIRDAILPIVDTITGKISGIVSFVNDLINKFKEAWEWFLKLIGKGEGQSQSAGFGTPQPWAPPGMTMEQFIALMMGEWGILTGDMADTWRDLLEGMESVWDWMWDMVVQRMDIAVRDLRRLFELLATQVKQTWAAINVVMGSTITALIGDMRELGTVLDEIIRKLIEAYEWMRRVGGRDVIIPVSSPTTFSAPSWGGASAGAPQVTVNVGPVTIANGMDLAVFEAQVLQTVTRAVRGY